MHPDADAKVDPAGAAGLRRRHVLYLIEAVFHLAAVVDSDALARGDAAPVAFTHMGLALVLSPVAGLAVVGIVGGLPVAAPAPPLLATA